MEKVEKSKKKKGIKVYIPLFLVIAIVLIGGWFWYKDYSKYINTDDALVDADNVSVSSKILGRIAKIYVQEGDSAKKGMLLAELDSTDLLAQREQAIAAKEQAEASQIQSEAKLDFDTESINVLEVNKEKASEDFTRAKNQFSGEVISKEQFDHSKKALEAAEAQLKASKTQLEVSKAQVKTAATSIETAKAQIGVINTQLKNTKLYAPSNGIVAKRWLLPGDIAQPGQSIYTIIDNKKFWIIIYLEETKISELHIGQKAIYTLDAYSGVTFTGKVFQIGSNTAAQFSLIPPNNASGNFTKVTQRVPIKVSIDEVDKGKIIDYKFLSGMSAVVKIIK